MTTGFPPSSHTKRRAVIAGTAFVGLLVLAGLWVFSPLRTVVDTRVLIAAGQRVAANPLAPLFLLATYIVGSLVMMPLSLLIGATIVVFGAWPGVAYAMVGALVAGSIVFGLGRVAGHAAVEEWLGRRRGSMLSDLNARLARRGVLAVALVRLTPIPYSLVNAVAGISEIRFRDFVIGTALGLVPVLTLIASVSHRVDAWLEHPDTKQFLGLIAIVVLAIAVSWSLRRWAVRRGRQADDAER